MIKYLSVLIVSIFILIPFISQADEINMWQDAKGNWHLTDLPPDQPVKKYMKESYTPDDPRAVANYKWREKQRLEYNDAIRKHNIDLDNTRKAYESRKSELKEASRNQKIKWAQEDLERENKRKARYDEYRDDSRYSRNKTYWNNRAKEAEDEARKKQSELLELENTK
jgi:hypothetical protein